MEFSSLFQSVSKLEVLMGEMSACHAPAADNFVESFFSVHLRWIPVDTRSQRVDALVYGFYKKQTIVFKKKNNIKMYINKPVDFFVFPGKNTIFPRFFGLPLKKSTGLKNP